MTIARISSLFWVAFLCCFLAAADARAQIPAPYIAYTAKFTCGTESKNESDDVVAGVYASSINIHNPQARVTVRFIKKIVPAPREDTEIAKPVILRGVLKPDQADRVDCPFIQKVLPGVYVEGVVVLEVPPVKLETTTIQPVLDVIAKYTARPADGGVSTQSVVPVDGKTIRN
jgi:hypothetical protein